MEEWSHSDGSHWCCLLQYWRAHNPHCFMHQCQEIHLNETQLLCIFFMMRKKYYDHWQNQHDEFNTAKQDQSTVQQDSGNLIRFNSYSWCSFYCDAYEWFSSICSSSRSAAVMIYERWFSCSWSTYLTLVYKCYYSWWADMIVT